MFKSCIYSVPYKPKTNSVESFFSQFKHYFKHDEIGITFPNGGYSDYDYYITDN